MFGEHDDKNIERALDACWLMDTMREHVDLDFEVTENGSNSSVDQRQLLCLGRALLKDSQVVVLDEATSNVSNQAAEKIQQTLRKEMAHCIILTVAHRLHTVIGSDRIIVMDKGRIAEVGNPAKLISRPSLYADLVDETALATAAHLRNLAYEADCIKAKIKICPYFMNFVNLECDFEQFDTYYCVSIKKILNSINPVKLLDAA